MSVHDDTLQRLQESLSYVKGDKTKGRSMTIEIPDDDIKFNQLPQEKQKVIRIIIDDMPMQVTPTTQNLRNLFFIHVSDP